MSKAAAVPFWILVILICWAFVCADDQDCESNDANEGEMCTFDLNHLDRKICAFCMPCLPFLPSAICGQFTTTSVVIQSTCRQLATESVPTAMRTTLVVTTTVLASCDTTLVPPNASNSLSTAIIASVTTLLVVVTVATLIGIYLYIRQKKQGMQMMYLR